MVRLIFICLIYMQLIGLQSPTKRNQVNGGGMSGTSELRSINSNTGVNPDWQSLPPDASSQNLDEDYGDLYNLDTQSPQTVSSQIISPLHTQRPSIATSRTSSSTRDISMADSPSFASRPVPQQHASLGVDLSPSSDTKPSLFSDYYAVDNLDAYNYGLLHTDFYPGPLSLDPSYCDTPTTNISLTNAGNPYLDPSLFPSSSNISHLRHERLM